MRAYTWMRSKGAIFMMGWGVTIQQTVLSCCGHWYFKVIGRCAAVRWTMIGTGIWFGGGGISDIGVSLCDDDAKHDVRSAVMARQHDAQYWKLHQRVTWNCRCVRQLRATITERTFWLLDIVISKHEPWTIWMWWACATVNIGGQKNRLKSVDVSSSELMSSASYQFVTTTGRGSMMAAAIFVGVAFEITSIGIL